MRRTVRIALAMLIICALTLASRSALADAGSFSGGSDWGGSSSDWGGGSDWGSSSGGSDWSSSSGSWSNGGYYYDNGTGGSGSSSGGISGSTVIMVIVIAVIIAMRMRKSGQSTTAQQMYTASFPGEGLPLSTLKQKDPNFDEQAILQRVANQYVQMQSAWEKKDWEPMRAIMTDALYNQMARQLDELKQKGLTNHVDRIAVLDTFISKYMQEADLDVLVVRIKTRICDYTTKDGTGEIVQGSQTRELFMTYDWKLTRNKDRVTLAESELSSVSCPHCGAPLSVNESGKCDYCGSVVTLSDHDWALTAIKGISQRSAN